ncbi:MAG: ComF family protein [Parvibaculaceae bacterium]
MLTATLRRTATTLRTLLRQAADIALPPQCIACGKPLSATGALCSVCWLAVDFIEAPFCDVSGLPLSTDAVDGIRPDAAANPPPYARARAALRYSDASASLILRFKYADRLDAAASFAGWMARAGADVLEGADFIVPVPLHHWRLMARRYN